MASEELRSKLALLRERKLADRLLVRFQNIEIVRYRRNDDIPIRIREYFISCTSMDSVPRSEVAHALDASGVSEWRRRIVELSCVGQEFLFRTGMEHFQWAQCLTSSGEWTDELFDARENDIAIVSNDLKNCLRVYEMEYKTVAFWM